jgi:hypothetical protein
MDRVSHPETAITTKEPFTPAQIRALKIAIVIMSIILVLGFTAILARLFYLAKQPPTAVSPARAPIAALMPDIDLPLPQGAQIQSVSLTSTGDLMAVQFNAPAGAGVVIVDLASGKIVSRVRLTP